MNHVIDELELYAVDALPAVDRDRVTAHLTGCPACHDELTAIARVVDALPEAVPDREPPARLRDRILASARAEAPVPAAPGRARTPWRPRRIAVAGLAAAAVVLAAVDLGALNRLQTTTEERNTLHRTIADVSFAERSWYMRGTGEYAGSGGTLYVTGKTGRAFVLFHDLKPIEPAARYTVWLVTTDGQRWIRAASFSPDGQPNQRVDIDAQVVAYRRCAVTVEAAATERPSGLVVMESNIGPPPAQ